MRLTTHARRVVLLVLAAGCALSAGASWSTPVSRQAAPVGGPQLGSGGTVQGANSTPLPATVTARAFVIADATTGDVLAARAPHVPLPPASTLKTLTALAVLQHVPVDRQLAAEASHVAVECTCVGIEPGRVYTVDALLHAVLLKSGNDAANVLAMATGDHATTIAAMNTLARRLRADDTHAVTPSGLDATGQQSSAYDLALIVRAGLADERFRGYFDAPSYTFGPVVGDQKVLTSHNALRKIAYPGQIGGKDGWTTPARHTFVGAARRNGRTLVVSVLGADRTYGTQVTALLDWAFAQPATIRPVGELARPRTDSEMNGTPPPAPHAGDSTPPPNGKAPVTEEIMADEEPAEQADVDPLAAEPVPSPRLSPEPTDADPVRDLPYRTQASLSLGAVLCTGFALWPGRRPQPTHPAGAPRPPRRGRRRPGG